MKPVLLSPELKNSAQNEKETEKLYNAFMRNLSKEERAAHDNTILSNASNLRAALSTNVRSHKVAEKEQDFERFNFDSFATDSFCRISTYNQVSLQEFGHYTNLVRQYPCFFFHFSKCLA